MTRTVLFLLLVPVLILNIGCGIRVLTLVSQQSVLKEDYAEANSIGNGLLSVDVWKTHLETIAARKLVIV
jgi:hypothetical protein